MNREMLLNWKFLAAHTSPQAPHWGIEKPPGCMKNPRDIPSACGGAARHYLSNKTSREILDIVLHHIIPILLFISPAKLFCSETFPYWCRRGPNMQSVPGVFF